MQIFKSTLPPPDRVTNRQIQETFDPAEKYLSSETNSSTIYRVGSRYQAIGKS